MLYIIILLLVLAFDFDGNQGTWLLLARNELLDLLDVVRLEGLQRIQARAVQLGAVDLVVELAVLGQVVGELVYFSELLQLLVLGQMRWRNLHRPPRRRKRCLNLCLAPARVGVIQLQRIDSRVL